MADSSLGGDEVLTVRWANEDPNAQVHFLIPLHY